MQRVGLVLILTAFFIVCIQAKSSSRGSKINPDIAVRPSLYAFYRPKPLTVASPLSPKLSANSRDRFLDTFLRASRKSSFSAIINPCESIQREDTGYLGVSQSRYRLSTSLLHKTYRRQLRMNMALKGSTDDNNTNDINNRPLNDSVKQSPLPSRIKYFATFIGGALISAVLMGGIFQPMRSTEDIPVSYFKEKRELEGDIVKVIDGDTYKFYNFNSMEKLFGIRLNQRSREAMTIRIYGVDTPETPKQGNPGQKYGLEAKEFASKKLLTKKVKVKLLKKDQYNRVLGVVRYNEGLRWNVDMSEELLKQGLATVYRQGGAEYDGRKDTLEQLEKDAINARKGMWSNGKENAELPSEYKKKIKAKQ